MKLFAIALFGLTTLLSGFGCDDNGRRRRDDDRHRHDRGRNYGHDDRYRHDNDRWRHGSYRHSDGFLIGESATSDPRN